LARFTPQRHVVLPADVVERAVRAAHEGAGVRIVCTAKPKGGKDALEAGKDGGLVVRVRAAPVDGAANAAVIAVVADALGVAKSTVTLVRGQTARHKELHVAGLGVDDVKARLVAAGSQARG
jgi:uncharacterized protein